MAKVQYDRRRGVYFTRIQSGGQRVYFNLGGSEKEARRELKKLIAQTSSSRCAGAQAAVLTPEGMTLRELAHLHLEWVQANRAKRTYEIRRRYVNEFLRFCASRVQHVAQLTASLLHEYTACARKNAESSSNTGIAHLRHVKSMLLWAANWDVCANPVKKFPSIRESPPATKRFTDEEFRKLLAIVPSDFRDFLVFGLLTGLRPQELRALKRSDIVSDDQGRPFLRVERHKTLRMTRSAKPRTIPLNKMAEEIIARCPLSASSDFIFLDGDGNPYQGGVLRRRLVRWCKRAKIDPKPPYALRHTFATRLAASRVNQTVLGHLMGHSTLQTTARYVANIDEHYRDAIDAGELAIRRLLDAPATTDTTKQIAKAS